jgi:DNA-binding IclR family transcriptional regulator
MSDQTPTEIENTRTTCYDVPAVRKAIRLIKLLCESDQPLGVSEISRALDINKNMTFRLLNTLNEEGWIVQDNGEPRYRMSLQAFQVTSQPVNRMGLKEVANGPLRKLWKETGESIYLGILHGESVLYLEHFDGTRNIKIAGMVGGAYPLHCSAPGKVLLADASKDLIEEMSRKPLKTYTESTLNDPIHLKEHLKQVRVQGWATDNEEYGRGLVCFAVPIKDYTGKVIAAIGLSTSTITWSIEEVKTILGPKVIETGNEISRQLGYAGESSESY